AHGAQPARSRAPAQARGQPGQTLLARRILRRPDPEQCDDTDNGCTSVLLDDDAEPARQTEVAHRELDRPHAQAAGLGWGAVKAGRQRDQRRPHWAGEQLASTTAPHARRLSVPRAVSEGRPSVVKAARSCPARSTSPPPRPLHPGSRPPEFLRWSN